MSTVDEVMDILKDDKRHSLSEIAERLKLTQKKAREILQFLAEYDFATFDQKSNKAIIDPELKELLLLEEQVIVTATDKKNNNH